MARCRRDRELVSIFALQSCLVFWRSLYATGNEGDVETIEALSTTAAHLQRMVVGRGVELSEHYAVLTKESGARQSHAWVAPSAVDDCRSFGSTSLTIGTLITHVATMLNSRVIAHRRALWSFVVQDVKHGVRALPVCILPVGAIDHVRALVAIFEEGDDEDALLVTLDALSMLASRVKLEALVNRECTDGRRTGTGS